MVFIFFLKLKWILMTNIFYGKETFVWRLAIPVFYFSVLFCQVQVKLNKAFNLIYYDPIL